MVNQRALEPAHSYNGQFLLCLFITGHLNQREKKIMILIIL